MIGWGCCELRVQIGWVRGIWRGESGGDGGRFVDHHFRTHVERRVQIAGIRQIGGALLR